MGQYVSPLQGYRFGGLPYPGWRSPAGRLPRAGISQPFSLLVLAKNPTVHDIPWAGYVAAAGTGEKPNGA